MHGNRNVKVNINLNCLTRLSTWDSVERKSPQKLRYIHHEAEAYLPNNVP